MAAIDTPKKVNVFGRLRSIISRPRRQKITWYVPRWFYVPRVWRSMQELVNRKSIARITAASCAFYVAAAGFLQWAMPQIILPGPGQLIGAALVMPGYILLTFALLTIIPPVVIVRSDKIVRSHGQSATHIPSSSIYKSYLVFHSGDRVRLRLCYTNKNGRKRVLLVAVPATIDFDKLSDLLPEYPIVRDGRGIRRSKTEADISDKAFLVTK